VTIYKDRDASKDVRLLLYVSLEKIQIVLNNKIWIGFFSQLQWLMDPWIDKRRDESWGERIDGLKSGWRAKDWKEG
jgi:hypothetical protein